MKNSNQGSFPRETMKGHVSVDEHYVTWGAHNKQEKRACLGQLQYAYLLVNKRGEAFLFLFDDHQHAIPVHFQGFEQTYTVLSERFGFDDDAFFDHLHQPDAEKIELWRRRGIQNYRVLDGEQYDDYDQGFEIQSPDKAFVGWDTPYKDVAASEHVVFGSTPYQDSVGKFRHPVRVGNLILDNLTFYRGGNPEAPVLHFYTQCFDSTSTARSYEELKALFSGDFPAQDQHLFYERADQKNHGFDAAGIDFNIVYTFDNHFQFDGGCTSLKIRNRRQYLALLVDAEYEEILSVEQSLQLPRAISAPSDVNDNPRIKRRPPRFPENGPPLIWVDRKNGILGFADQTHALRFDESEVAAISIQNILPAKGSGGAKLSVVLTDQTPTTVFYGKCYVFDDFKDRLAALLNKEVIRETPYHDC